MRAFLVAGALVLSMAIAPAAQAVAFARAVEDLPLMNGLVETDGGFAFETARGRIVRVEAAGPVSADGVAAFYAETLPALGWHAVPDASGDYQRAGERLTLSVAAQNGAQARVVIEIAPVGAGAGR